jgi:hypothetical protein
MRKNKPFEVRKNSLRQFVIRKGILWMLVCNLSYE